MKVNSNANERKSDQWQRGYSLPQSDYTDDSVYQSDLKVLGTKAWLLVDHESRIPNPGDFFVFNYGNESIVVVRDRQKIVRAHFNTCRHRGSKICLKHEGSVRTLTCPYHAWTYDLSGSLMSIPLDDGKVDKNTLGLESAHVRVFHGLIFLNFSKNEPPSFEEYSHRLNEFLAPYQLENTKIATRRVFATRANWKLVVENFLECYHCKPAHPTYCSVHDDLKMLALGAGPGSGEKYMEKYEPIYDAFVLEQKKLGRWVEPFNDGPEAPFFQSAARIPIKEGSVTESIDGKAVAPAIAAWGDHDGVQAGCVFNPVSTILVNSDHAIIFRMTPMGSMQTDAEAIWLVKGDAVEGRDYDVEKLTAVWAPTLSEDKTITENNQLGILSERYVPGPYQSQEQKIEEFTAWYRSEIHM